MVAPTLLLTSSILFAVTMISARPLLSVSGVLMELVAATSSSSAKPVAGMAIPVSHNKLLVWYSFALKRDDMCYPLEMGLTPRPLRRTVAHLRFVLTPALLRAISDEL